jgi:putative CocE/NonD family hydrolase
MSTKIIKKTASMYTSDGIRLDADIYRPDTEEKLPILLMRQPYGRSIASTVVYAHPSWYARQGYAVIIQDVRGRGTSAGEFRLFEAEITDGLETIAWASQLSGTTGEIGMYGFSYQGMTQLYAASHKTPALKVICPATIAYNLYSDWAYENDAFCLQTNLAWAIQLAAETAKLRGDATTFQKLYQAARNLPLGDAIAAYPQIMQELALDSFYCDWISRPATDEYWRKLSPQYLLEDVDLPMLHIGGWFDPYLRGTIDLYRAMSQRSSYPQHLIVAPWAHLPWGRKQGDTDYGSAAISNIDSIQIQWFDRFLKNKESPIFDNPPIALFEMGSNRWRYFHELPTQPQKTFYLQSTGLAGIREDDGKLVLKNSQIPPSEDTIVHDPWRSVTSLGGHAALPAGSFERSSLDTRTDILTYTSDPLESDLSISGAIEIVLYCRADAPSFDICAILSQVFPDGKVYNFTQGYQRNAKETLESSSTDFEPYRFQLQPTCIRIEKGNSLRLSVSGACFPAYSVNSGTGLSLDRERLIDAKIITLSLASGDDRPSQVSFSSF